MAGSRKQTSSKDVGNATDYSLSQPRARGALDAQDVNQKINPNDFLSKLDSIVEAPHRLSGCKVGRVVEALDEPMKTKFSEALLNDKIESARIVEVLAEFDITVGSDVMRRHRRRLRGKDGCRCPLES